jgi:lysophospholipid acyltransferase (LPLAT)-like uncharacterized protein
MRFSVKQRFVCWLSYVLFWLLQSTWRMRFVNPELRDAVKAQHSKGVLCYACWHHSTLTSMLSVAGRRFAVLVSKSFDGDVIAFVNKKFGVSSARGSSSRNGKEGFSELLAFIDRGYEVGFTVDGPRGPRHKVKAGVIALASRSGIPIIPTASCGVRYWTFHKSWDKFRLPKFFTEVLVIYGPPIFVKSHIDESEFKHYQSSLESALMNLENELESLIAEPSSITLPLKA